MGLIKSLIDAWQRRRAWGAFVKDWHKVDQIADTSMTWPDKTSFVWRQSPASRIGRSIAGKQTKEAKSCVSQV